MKTKKITEERFLSKDAVAFLSMLPSGLTEEWQQKAFVVFGRTKSERVAQELLEALMLDDCFPTTTEKEQKRAEEMAVKLGWEKDMPLEIFASKLRKTAITNATK